MKLTLRTVLLVALTVPWLASAAPIVSGQSASELQFGPDPAMITLTADDLPGWVQTGSERRVYTAPAHPGTTVLADSPVPVLAQVHASTFTSTAQNGATENLSAITSAFRAVEMAAAYHHAAAGSTANRTMVDVSSLPADEAAAWWFGPAGGTAYGFVFARLANVELELALTAPSDHRPTDESVSGYAEAFLHRAQGADPAPPTFDWDQVLPSTAPPWTVALTAADLGQPWKVASVERTWTESGRDPGMPLLAAQEWFNDGTVDGSVETTASVFGSADAATTAMEQWIASTSGRATKQDVPARGDQTVGFRQAAGAAQNLNALVTYEISIRRGVWLVRVRVTRPQGIMPSPEFAIQAAIKTDAKVAAALGQPT